MVSAVWIQGLRIESEVAEFESTVHSKTKSMIVTVNKALIGSLFLVGNSGFN